MKTRIIHLQPTVDDHRIARYAAAAIALSVVEAAIPSPLPGVKPGLANIITLIVLARSPRGSGAAPAALARPFRRGH